MKFKRMILMLLAALSVAVVFGSTPQTAQAASWKTGLPKVLRGHWWSSYVPGGVRVRYKFSKKYIGETDCFYQSHGRWINSHQELSSVNTFNHLVKIKHSAKNKYVIKPADKLPSSGSNRVKITRKGKNKIVMTSRFKRAWSKPETLTRAK
ncbi:MULTISPECIES: hypothetical protein [Levilactobacillus]|uniref:hypothetical protein n=1 Tax=Levilactobacillus TaxID=2767886 RepID=UPI001951F571|nr:hypothetical protein [Levilactobacillus sp. 244-2]